MSMIASMADRLLARLVPQRTAAACSAYRVWRTCYCSGGLRYARGCWTCSPYGCCYWDVIAVGCPGDTGCIVVGTC